MNPEHVSEILPRDLMRDQETRFERQACALTRHRTVLGAPSRATHTAVVPETFVIVIIFLLFLFIIIIIMTAVAVYCV